MQGDERVLGPLSRQQESRLPRQNFPLNLPTNRRLCSTVRGRIVEGWAAHCCAVSAARSRAATMTNLARSSLALVLPALFDAAKSCALVNLCMICPRWSASSQPTTNQILLLITAISWHLCEHVLFPILYRVTARHRLTENHIALPGTHRILIWRKQEVDMLTSTKSGVPEKDRNASVSAAEVMGRGGAA